MIAYTSKWSEKRPSYEYEIDGIVFKLDNLEQRENLGMTAHHPRWASVEFPPRKRFRFYWMSIGKPVEQEQ